MARTATYPLLNDEAFDYEAFAKEWETLTDQINKTLHYGKYRKEDEHPHVIFLEPEEYATKKSRRIEYKARDEWLVANGYEPRYNV